MSGVIINASQLTKLLNLNFIIQVIINMPRKERLRSADNKKALLVQTLWLAFSEITLEV